MSAPFRDIGFYGGQLNADIALEKLYHDMRNGCDRGTIIGETCFLFIPSCFVSSLHLQQRPELARSYLGHLGRTLG